VVLALAILLSAGPADVSAPPELSAYAGRIVVLNAWASWCAPCRKEMPLLADLDSEYGPRGVQVVGASIDEPEDEMEARRFAQRAGVRYPLLLGWTTARMTTLLLGDAVPATAIFDRDGRLVFRLIGELRDADLRARLEWLLGDRASECPADVVVPNGITVDHFREHHESGEEHEEESEERGSAVPT